MICRIYRKLATQLVCAELGSIDLNWLYSFVQVATELYPVDALMTDSKSESATLQSKNITLTRILRHSIPRLCRSSSLTVDVKKTVFTFAAVNAFSVGIGAVLSSQWKRYPVLA